MDRINESRTCVGRSVRRTALHAALFRRIFGAYWGQLVGYLVTFSTRYFDFVFLHIRDLKKTRRNLDHHLLGDAVLVNTQHYRIIRSRENELVVATTDERSATHVRYNYRRTRYLRCDLSVASVSTTHRAS